MYTYLRMFSNSTFFAVMQRAENTVWCSRMWEAYNSCAWFWYGISWCVLIFKICLGWLNLNDRDLVCQDIVVLILQELSFIRSRRYLNLTCSNSFLSGGNSGHFARLIPYLADNYRVYAIDLLGFGASDKPHDVKYGPELWAELLCGNFLQKYAVSTI